MAGRRPGGGRGGGWVQPTRPGALRPAQFGGPRAAKRRRAPPGLRPATGARRPKTIAWRGEKGKGIPARAWGVYTMRKRDRQGEKGGKDVGLYLDTGADPMVFGRQRTDGFPYPAGGLYSALCKAGGSPVRPGVRAGTGLPGPGQGCGKGHLRGYGPPGADGSRKGCGQAGDR